MKRFLWALPMVLAACAGEDVVSKRQPVGYLPDAIQLTAATNWRKPETIELDLVNHAFIPNEITVKRNKPYRLVLTNGSTSDHTFVSDGLFRSMAVRQLVSRAGTSTAPWVEKITITAGETKELWFVPARYGAFPFECTVTGHALLGMKGVVNVVE